MIVNKKLIVYSIFGLLLISFISLILYNNEEDVKENMEEKLYQGPVPIGYDLEHFRKTGETIKEAKE